MMMDDTHNGKSNEAEMMGSITQLSPLAQPGPMTEMERFIFECWGYLVIQDVLSEAECDEVLEAAKRVHGSQPAEKFMQIGKGFETGAGHRAADRPPGRAAQSARAVRRPLRAPGGLVYRAAGRERRAPGTRTAPAPTTSSSALSRAAAPAARQLQPDRPVRARHGQHGPDPRQPPQPACRCPRRCASSRRLPHPADHPRRRGTVLLFHNGVWHCAHAQQPDLRPL